MIRVASAVIVAAQLWALPVLSADDQGEAIKQVLDATAGALDDGGQHEVIETLGESDETVGEQEFGQWDLWIANTYQAKIELLDAVKQGCWTNPTSAKDAVEQALGNHNIEIDPEDNPGAYIVISAFGGRIDSDKCAVTVSVQLMHYVEIVRPQWFTYTDNGDNNFWRLTEVFMRKNILVGSQDSMSRIIERYAVGQINSLLLNIYKSRERLSQTNIN